MDVQTETAIFKGLAEYSLGRTVFIISHRLSAIRHADIIIAIKNGKIEDKGTHEALMQSDNIYSELVNQK
jgi:ABC-type multidrug transport system fused ATPase/permease subunit